MGSAHPKYREEPVHDATVTPFRLDKTEVSVATYAACVRAGVCEQPSRSGGCNWGRKGYDNHPINCVTFYQAKTLCHWLGRRLPNQAEWEYAARGKDSLIYPWGDEPPGTAVCWSKGTKSATCVVGSNAMDQSSAGVMDLAGNVKEWIDDCKGCGLGEESARGGAHHNTEPMELRASRRSFPAVASDSWQGGFYPDVGFRCANSLKKLTIDSAKTVDISFSFWRLRESSTPKPIESPISYLFYREDIFPCYAEALGRHPNLRGSLELELTVQRILDPFKLEWSRHFVRETKLLKDEISDQKLKECARHLANGWELPGLPKDEKSLRLLMRIAFSFK